MSHMQERSNFIFIYVVDVEKEGSKIIIFGHNVTSKNQESYHLVNSSQVGSKTERENNEKLSFGHHSYSFQKAESNKSVNFFFFISKQKLKTRKVLLES